MIRIIFSGMVQGVFFRATTKKYAQSLHINGYAKNLSNGNVEVLLDCTLDKANQLIELISNSGFTITNIEIDQVKESPVSGFTIL
ncbi:MAG: acylphosphatase [Rhabdochlamydiaceae bacterium]|nr:acylphosphatase [Candidatus Amphrikana amoebophyrae]